MGNYKPMSTPFAPHFNLSINACPAIENEINVMPSIPYFSVVGSLIYVMVCTRPDLAYAVSMVSLYA